MNYKKLIDRKIFILCTDVAEMDKVYNFLMYKKFDIGDWPFDGGAQRMFTDMGFYLRSGIKYGLLFVSNRGILGDNNHFTHITDVEFNKYNKIPWWVRRKSIHGYFSRS